jgi:hypothetical protein
VAFEQYGEEEEVRHIYGDLTDQIRDAAGLSFRGPTAFLRVFHATANYALIRYPDGTQGGPWIRYCPGWVDLMFLNDWAPSHDRRCVWRDLFDGFLTIPASRDLIARVEGLITDLSPAEFVCWCDENHGADVETIDTLIGAVLVGGGYRIRMTEAFMERCVTGVGKMLTANSREMAIRDHERRMERAKTELSSTLASWRDELKSCDSDDQINDLLMRFAMCKPDVPGLLLQ